MLTLAGDGAPEEVNPPTTRHAFLQFFVARELDRQRPEGTTLTECPVETDIGMRNSFHPLNRIIET